MKNTIVTNQEVLITVTGPNSPYSVSWSSIFKDKKFVVDIIITPTLIGGVGEVIELQIAEIQSFKSDKNIPMDSPQTYEFTILAMPVDESASSGGSGASYTFLFTMLISLSVSLLTGGSIELMWSLTNTLQILFFFGMLNLYYPSDLEMVYELMGYSNFDNPVTRYVGDLFISTISLVQSPVSNKFTQLGFTSTNILSNSLDKLLMVILMLGSAVTVFLLMYLCRKKDNKATRIIKRIDKSIRYESLSRFLVELVLNLSVACLINITYGIQGGVQGIVAYFVACIFFIGIIAMMCYSIYYPIQHFKSIKEFPKYHERHSLLFQQFKKDNQK